jgi:hypothetical protein
LQHDLVKALSLIELMGGIGLESMLAKVLEDRAWEVMVQNRVHFHTDFSVTPFFHFYQRYCGPHQSSLQ